MIEPTKGKKKKIIKFGVPLNEEQKEAKAIILNNDITIVRGSAGSGKTLLACQVGLDGLFNTEYRQLVIARPAVTAGENLGFLPGDKNQKLEEYLQPVMDNFRTLYGDTQAKRTKIDRHLEQEDIVIGSIGHLRGRTFSNSFVIVDEAQNLTEDQMLMVVTRLGKGSKMVITGDLKQLDLNGKSGLARLLIAADKINRMAKVELLENHRSGIVKDILKEW
jgi:phosphate starvation-inducible PhoH-like protein